jgi:hypothetical protein
MHYVSRYCIEALEESPTSGRDVGAGGFQLFTCYFAALHTVLEAKGFIDILRTQKSVPWMAGKTLLFF